LISILSSNPHKEQWDSKLLLIATFDRRTLNVDGDRAQSSKPEAEIQAEIRSILKQIVSTVTFLPIIDEPMVFNILVYTHESADVPANEWVDTDPLAIEASKSQQVKLRSFSTDVHRIEAMVSYRYEG
jgi:mitotic spindle assembly checkpoint protein MAD2